jgi:hypothetical protein
MAEWRHGERTRATDHVEVAAPQRGDGGGACAAGNADSGPAAVFVPISRHAQWRTTDEAPRGRKQAPPITGGTNAAVRPHRREIAPCAVAAPLRAASARPGAAVAESGLRAVTAAANVWGGGTRTVAVAVANPRGRAAAAIARSRRDATGTAVRDTGSAATAIGAPRPAAAAVGTAAGETGAITAAPTVTTGLRPGDTGSGMAAAGVIGRRHPLHPPPPPLRQPPPPP